MPIELTCSGCGETLRVPDDAAGKQARCPACKAVQAIPSARPAFTEPPLYIPGEPAQPTGNPYADRPVNPYASPAALPGEAGYPHVRRYTRAHRGGTILALGIVSIFCNVCFIPCIMALVMGNEDLQHMNAGRMDPEGRTLTSVGMGLAVVGLAIGVLGVLLQFLPALLR